MNKNRSIFFIIMMGLALTVSSCRVGKDYQRPDLNLPDTYRNGSASADTTSIGDIPWNEFFKDSTLLALIDTAILYNYDMQRALKNIEIFHQVHREARAQYLPAVNADIATIDRRYRSENFYSSATAPWYEEHGTEPPRNMYMYTPQNTSGFSLSWELDIWGKIRRQNENAAARYLQTHEARKMIQTQLVAEIAQGYYNLLMLDAQLEVARRNLQLTDSTLRIVQLQYDAGKTTSLAIQQTRSQLLSARSLIPQLEREVAIQENTLRALAGQMPDSVARSGKLEDFLGQPIAAGIPLHMVTNRPDVRGSELALQAANARVGVAQAYRYPTLTIDATGGLNSMLPSNWVSIPGSLFGGLVGSITQPVFNRRKLKTDLEIAKLERDKAELDFQENVLTAINEITNSLIILKKLREEHDIMVERVKVAQLGIRQSDLLFKAGRASYLEIINAQQTAINSELQLVSLKQRLLLARVDLYRALGGGWQGMRAGAPDMIF